jgi:hypothetical protein
VGGIRNDSFGRIKTAQIGTHHQFIGMCALSQRSGCNVTLNMSIKPQFLQFMRKTVFSYALRRRLIDDGELIELLCQECDGAATMGYADINVWVAI